MVEEFVFYLSAQPVWYQYRNESWRVLSKEPLRTDAPAHVLIENPGLFKEKPPGFLRPIHKIASTIDVLLTYPESKGAVIYWLVKQQDTICYVVFQGTCLLSRQIPLDNLERELERTKAFLQRFCENTQSIQIKQIFIPDVLFQLRSLPKIYHHPYHSWITLQFASFWQYILPRAFLILFLSLLGGLSVKIYDLLECKYDFVPSLSVDGIDTQKVIANTKKFEAYLAMKQRFPELGPLLETIKHVTKNEWVAVGIIWQAEILEICFQIAPRFRQQCGFKKQQLEYRLNRMVIWENQGNDDFIILKILPS